jgi:oligoribonuclease
LEDKRISFICLDLETTGLDPESDCILEIGVTLTDKDLKPIDSFESIVWPTVQLDIMNDYVYNMHSTSGLLGDLNSSQGNIPSVDVVENSILEWFKSYGLEPDKFPMMGSSVHFDRSFLRQHMPNLEGFFSFMNIDISSIKQLVRIWDPNSKWTRSGTKSHRALDDIEDTLDEASFYYNKFFNRSKNA